MDHINITKFQRMRNATLENLSLVEEKNNPAKDRKALATYVELKGYKHGEIGNGRKKKDPNGLSTLDEIAKELNMSTTNLKRALRIERNLTDSMKEL